MRRSDPRLLAGRKPEGPVGPATDHATPFLRFIIPWLAALWTRSFRCPPHQKSPHGAGLERLLFLAVGKRALTRGLGLTLLARRIASASLVRKKSGRAHSPSWWAAICASTVRRACSWDPAPVRPKTAFNHRVGRKYPA